MTDGSAAPSTTLSDILQGQPERPAAATPPAAPSGPSQAASGGGVNVLAVILPVVLGAAVLAAVAGVSIRLFRLRRAGQVVPQPDAPTTARGMLGECSG